MQDFLDNLNKNQLEAVTYGTGPLLVLAGAGTGKTKVLTSRFAYLIASNAALSQQILAVTFTNKAAKEITNRITRDLGENFYTPWIGTFHSLSAKILRIHAKSVGLNSNFSIIDAEDQIRIIKKLLAEKNIDEKLYPAKQIAYKISLWKDRALSPTKIQMNILLNNLDIKAKEIYADYQEKLLELNACDFGDLILHVIELCKKEHNVLRSFHEQFRYILVDEYQDTSVAQYLWLRIFAEGHQNIFCVGDDDQSIYGWRGAEVENILRFTKDFKDAKIIKLEENYRSTSHILSAASSVISANHNRHKKTLYTSKKTGNKIKVISCFDDYAEAKTIADEIESLQYKKVKLSNIAILVRAFFQTRSIEETFINYGIPYKIVGGLKFYERKEIKDLIAYLRLLHNQDDNLALERIINTPRRGIGPSALAEIINISRTEGISYFKACQKAINLDLLKGKAKTELSKFTYQLDSWKSSLSSDSHAAIAKIMYKESGYEAMLKNDKDKDSEIREENIKEFLSALEEFESLEEFLEHIALVNDKENQEEDNIVNIMTLHSAKGLEFTYVFLSGWEEGIFPHQRVIDEGQNKAIEEERRLAYVGITRAKEHLYITYAANRRQYNRWQSNLPSRFLSDLPKENIEFIHQGGGNKIYSNNKYSNFNSYTTPSKNLKQTVTLKAKDEVTHEKFGKGTVINIIGDVVEVNFEEAGNRFTMLKALKY